MTTLTGARVFDGFTFLAERAFHVFEGCISTNAAGESVQLDGGYILPGLVDLQVNGGGGQMVCGQTTADDLRAICAVHASLGATSILPTLITDTPAATAAVLAAGAVATRQRIPGFLGLHLEGPHLDRQRKGAHDPALIRPMTDGDLNSLCEGAKHLSSVMVTVAPECVTALQITAMAAAGITVSLGHSDCTADAAKAAFTAGARCVTHLFNAMSQLGSREPGLVGAALLNPVFVGLIADGIHVAPETIRIAMAAKPDHLFLVSDSMAVAGTDASDFALGHRRILRRNGCLTLENGTLAGADLTLPRAIGIIANLVGIAPEVAFAMATSRPAACLGRQDIGTLRPGAPADFVHLDDNMVLQSVWRSGVRLR